MRTSNARAAGMVLVNLLPWRVRKQRYRRYCLRQAMLAAAIGVMLLLFVMHLCLQRWIELLDGRIAMLKQQLDQAELRHQGMNMASMPGNASLNASMVRDIEAEQLALQAFIQQMTDVHSADVCFTEISRYQNKIRFTGKVSTAEKLSAFFSVWPAASHFNQIRINQMKPDDTGLLDVAFEGTERRGDNQHD